MNLIERGRTKSVYAATSSFSPARMLQLKVCCIVEEYGLKETALALGITPERLTSLTQGMTINMRQRPLNDIEQMFQFIAQEKILRIADEKF